MSSGSGGVAGGEKMGSSLNEEKLFAGKNTFMPVRGLHVIILLQDISLPLVDGGKGGTA